MNDKNAVMMEKSELMKLVDITPYANNPRKNDRAIEPVMNSIREFGFNQPIVVDKGWGGMPEIDEPAPEAWQHVSGSVAEVDTDGG